MNTGHLDEKAIFDIARQIESPGARMNYLEQVCGEDRALRERVAAMVLIGDEHRSFLESPPLTGVASTLDFAPIVERPGTQIGPYKLLEQIGEGGMGVVYVASQREPVRRKVALKIIKPGMDSREVVTRFEAERQALAMMDHPNIAKVFDGGATDSGRPYFAMELVQGTPITEYCDHAQLSTRERLALFVTLCHGVQHAHQKGVIHRDLKPSNLLVEVHDVRPVPKIIDFGIAKAVGQQLTEQSLHTAFDQMVGTPLYMSPEQAGQSVVDVDTRSDIYSLGVVLYELLTGHTPFEKDTLRTGGVDEMRRIIRDVDPPRPSARVSTLQAADLSTISERRHIEPRKLSQQLRGDLDWIVMKAMDKDRDRRYASVSVLAADVQRYLDDEPVQARPPSLAHHAAKWVRRHRPLVWSSAAVLAVTVVASGVLFGTSYRRTTLLERDAGEHLAAATAFIGSGDYTAADRELADARGHLEAAGNDAGPLAEKVTSLTAAIAAKAQAMGDFEQFQNLRHRIHSEMYALDRDILDQAQEHARTALDLFGVFGTEPWKSQADFEHLDPARQAMLDEGAVELLFVWARLEMGKSDAQPAAERNAGYRRAIEALGKVAKSRPSITAVALWTADCWEAIGDTQASAEARVRAESLQPTAATDYYLLGEYHAQHGQQDEALACYWQALARQPDHYLSLLAAGLTLGALKEYKSAEAMLSGVIAMNPQSVLAFTKRGASRLEQGKILLAQADFQQAKKLDPELARALALRAREAMGNLDIDKAVADSTEALRVDPRSALAYNERANAHLLANRYEAALADAQEAIRLEPNNPGYLAIRGLIYGESGLVDRALADCDDSIRLDPNYVLAYWARAKYHIWKRDLEKARTDLDKTLRLAPTDPSVFVTRSQLYRARGELDKAIADLTEAIRLHPKNVWCFSERARIHTEKKDFEKAIADWNAAIKLAPKWPWIWTDRADTYRVKGELEKALADCDEAVRLDPNSAWVRQRRAAILRERGDFEKALADANEAIRLAPKFIWAFVERAQIYREKKDFDKALADYNEAIRLEPKNIGLRLDIAWQHHLNQEPDSAIADYSEAIRLDPKSALAFAGRGLIYSFQGEADNALADCNEAIRLDPQLAHAYLCRASAYRTQGNGDKALADYGEAIRLDPQFAWAHSDRAGIYAERGEFERALADYSEAIRLSPAPPCWARADRAALYVQLREFDKAVADYDQMGELGRGGWYHYKRKAEAHFRLKHYDQALESIAKAVELNPGDGSNLWWIKPVDVAKCSDEHFRQGILALADKAIETTRGEAQAHMARAMLYDAFGRDDEARIDFDKALELAPTEPLFWEWRAPFHAEHARWNETVADLTKSIELQPERMDCWYQRCLARLGGGQADEYRQDCREMLQRFGQTDNAGDCYWVAWACVLAPDATTNWATAVALAEKSAQGDPQSAMCSNALGAVLYRAGRYDEALARLSEAAALAEQTGAAGNLSPAYAWFFLAMTRHRLGHAEEAKQWLDKAVTWTDKTLADADQGTTDLPWNRRLTLRLLRDEATTLLGVTPPAAEPAPEPAAKVEEAQELPKSTPAPEAAKEEEKPQ
jgi:tetratricopeptide (TPR) repeat protein